jgi:lipopolysaccharide transport system ATP-binding protein
MKEVSQQGRTVIFVSHNLVAVKSLCTKGIVMDQGKLVFSGSADEAVENYMNANASKVQPSTVFSSPEDAIGNEFIKIKSVSVQPTNPTITDEFSIHFSFWNFSPGPSIFLAMDLINVYEEVVFGSGFTFETGIDNICEASCIIPADLMNDGLYEINLYFNSVEMRPIFQALNIISFEVSDKDRNYAYFGKVNGSVRPLLKWKVNPK